MVYSGFATPKNFSVLGFDKYVSNVNFEPYQLLLYSSGIGYKNFNETEALHDHKNSIHKATIPTTWSNHAAGDVPLYATGPLANILFSGTFDQTYLPHSIAFALCLFHFSDRCDEAFIQRTIPVNERKRGGIEELKKILNKESKTFQNSFEDVERRMREKNESEENSTADIDGDENVLNSDAFESSDLKGNMTSTDNSANIYQMRLNILINIILFLFLIE